MREECDLSVTFCKEVVTLGAKNELGSGLGERSPFWKRRMQKWRGNLITIVESFAFS